MEEIVKKTKAPAKPRKAATKKAAAPTNGSAHSNVTEMKPSHDQVAQLAHRFWAERGGQHGNHVDDWLRAEQELRGIAS